MFIHRISQVAVAGFLCTSLALAQTSPDQRIPERGADQQPLRRQQPQQPQPEQPQPEQPQPEQQPPGDDTAQRQNTTQQQDPRRSGTSGQAVPRSTQRPEFDDGGQFPTGDFFLLRATQIVGMEVRDATGQSLVGTIQDLLITPNYGWPVPLADPLESEDRLQQAPAAQRNTGRNPAQGEQPSAAVAERPSFIPGFNRSDLRFALIQVDAVDTERVAIVPWDLLQFQGSYFVLGFAFERILQAPSVMPGDPRVLQDDQWIEQVQTFYQDDMRQLQQRSGRQELQPGQQQRNAPPATGTQRQTPQSTTPRGGTSPPQSERRQPSQGGNYS